MLSSEFRMQRHFMSLQTNRMKQSKSYKVLSGDLQSDTQSNPE